MATFIGTLAEFNKFVGPKIRNLVQRKTKKYKGSQLNCSGCGELKELQAAHAFETRLEVIAKVLKQYSNGGEIRCDLKKAEDAIWAEHGNDSFVYLCEPCHKKFDAFRATVRGTTAALGLDNDDYLDWYSVSNEPIRDGVFECLDGEPPENYLIVGHGYRYWSKSKGWGELCASVLDAGKKQYVNVPTQPKHWRGLKSEIAFPLA